MPALDTMNKRMAAFEITYSNLLQKISLYHQEGRINKATGIKLKETLKTIDQARTVAHTAINQNNETGFNDSMSIMTITLESLRTILVEIEDAKRNSSARPNPGGSQNSNRVAGYAA